MRRSVEFLCSNDDGAVAPILAVSLFALVAAGGVAFDYSRMASLDTELQDAADQAALAAASQLDGQTGACTRAAAAASSLLNNNTRFANDTLGSAITVANEGTCDQTGSVKFYKTWDTTNDVPGTVANNAADAKYVVVTVDARRVNYALTPIVGALSTGDFNATAVATLSGGAICKVPPLMICNPDEAAGTVFPSSTEIGKGLKLEAGGGSTWAPGNYGYLDFGAGALALEAAMGSNVESDPCVNSSTVTTKPGNTASVPAGLNTRFDIYENGLVAYCAQGNGNCSPALDVLKDVAHPQFTGGAAPPNELAATSSPADNCAMANGSDPWELPTVQYLPDPTTRGQVGTAPSSMGLPRDICHAISADGDCTNGRFGDGSWDRNLYFQVNYGTTGTGWQSLAWLTSWVAAHPGVTIGTISRYNVYRAELDALAAGTIASRHFAYSATHGSHTNDYYNYATPRCAPGSGATATVKDRRVLTAAVVNCAANGVKGSSTAPPIGWVDLFLVEPSVNRPRTGQDQIYVEVIGAATRPDGTNAFQYYLRQRPKLVQ
jgi:hypothetical protein